MKQTANMFTGVSQQRRKLYLSCIRDFYFKLLPEMRKNQTQESVDKHGHIDSLGVEGGLEACIALFKQGELKLFASSLEDYMVVGYWDGHLRLVYDTKYKERNANPS